MYRLIPFRKLSDIKYIGPIIRLCESRFKDNSILVQDTEDMVVEEYTLKQLNELEEKYHIAYHNFSTIRSKLRGLIYDIKQENIDIVNNSFLNNRLKVECTDYYYDKFLMDIFDDVFDKKPNKSEYELYIGFDDFTFTMQLNGYLWEGLDKCLVLLSINNQPVTFLIEDVLLSDDYDAYFEVIQICKVKHGFDLVISFPQLMQYFGVSLTNDLKLIKFTNLDVFVNSRIMNKIDTNDLKSYIAKCKLADNLGELLCLE